MMEEDQKKPKIEETQKLKSVLAKAITRRRALKVGGVAALGLAFTDPIVRTIFPKPAFAQVSPGSPPPPPPPPPPVAVSDIRLKKNIEALTNVSEKVTKLQPVSFRWRADEYPEFHFGDQTELGLIAQDVEKIMPELVQDGEDGFKRVSYEKLPILLLQAVKELEAENAALQQHNNDLETRLAAIEQAVGLLGGPSHLDRIGALNV